MKTISQGSEVTLNLGDVASFFIHPDNFFVRDPKKPLVDVSMRLYNEYLKEFPRGAYHTGRILEIFKNRIDNKVWVTLYSIHVEFEISIPVHNILKKF